MPPEEEELYRNDAKREEHRGIKDFVVCRECRAKLKVLDNGPSGHLQRLHVMSPEQYQQKWKDAEGNLPPLICAATRAGRSTRAIRQFGAQRGRPRPNRKVRGHEAPASKWLMLCLGVEGNSCKAIGERVKRDATTVWDDLVALGMTLESPAFYEFGEPWTSAKSVWLKQATNLSVPELAVKTGIPESVIKDVVRHSRVRRSDPGIARKFSALRDDLLRELLAVDSRRSMGPDHRNKSAVLKTFLPGLLESYNLLRRALSAMRTYLGGDLNAGAVDLQRFLIEGAMREVADKSSRTLFRRFLPWAPDLMRFLEANLDRLRGPRDIRVLALEALAERWTTTPEAIAGVFKRRTRPIAPEKMRWLILSMTHRQRPAMAPAVAKVAVTRGRRLGQKGEDTDRQITLAAALLSLGGYSQPQMVPHLYPGQNNKEAGRKAVQKFLKRHSDAIEHEKVGMTTGHANAVIQAGLD